MSFVKWFDRFMVCVGVALVVFGACCILYSAWASVYREPHICFVAAMSGALIAFVGVWTIAAFDR